MGKVMAIKITYFSKEELKCPICEDIFRKESFLSGGGRLNADILTDELHRLYKPTEKYGKIYPLIYPVVVCPQCYFAAWYADFSAIPEKVIEAIKIDTQKRVQLGRDLFDTLDFRNERSISEGVASYLFAIYSYAFLPKSFSPKTKQAISALRCAWLIDDLIEDTQNKNWAPLKPTMYKRAYYFYKMAFEAFDKGEETVDGIRNLGPDLDKNYGYSGFLYMYCYLLYKYGLTEIHDEEIKKKTIEKAKQILSKLFGAGKSNRAKTVFILEKARELFEKFNEYVKASETDDY